MSDLLDVIDAAAQSKDWLILAIASVCVVVPIVLKALGKNVPLVGTAVEFVAGILKARKPKPPPPAPEGQAQGIGAVVPVTPPSPPPQDNLK